MARKMVTGEARNIEVCTTKERVELPCSGCGEMVMVTVPYSGDVLCPKCSKSTSYSLKTVTSDD